MTARIATLALLAFAALAWCGCSDPLGIEGVREATAGEVALARHAYARTAECLGLVGDVDRVTWRVVERITYRGHAVDGFFREDVIYLGRPDNSLFMYRIARHESVHHILWIDTGQADIDHRDERWPVCAPGTR